MEVSALQEFYFALLGDEVNLPLYVTGVGSTDPERHCVRPTGHVYNQVIYTAKGEGILTIDGEEYRIPENSGFFLPAHYPHDYLSKEGVDWETHWVSFSGAACEPILESLGLSKPVVFKTADLSSIERIWEKMLRTIHSTKIHSGHHNSSLIYSFLIELNKVISCPVSPRENHRMDQIKLIMDFIDQNYMNDITLNDMAKVVNLSPQYICRIFRETLNMRPFEHLTKKRIFEAKNLLMDTKLSINSISKAVGYNDCSYFCAVFKRQEKISPAEYRYLYADKNTGRSTTDQDPDNKRIPPDTL